MCFSLNSKLHALDVTRAGEDFEIELDGNTTSLELLAATASRVTFSFHGKVITAHFARNGARRWIHVEGNTYILDRHEGALREPQKSMIRQGAGVGLVVAPMPGQVRGVLVRDGAVVNAGQTLLLLEAMKMELRVTSPIDGMITSLHVKPGESVERDQILAQVREMDQDPK